MLLIVKKDEIIIDEGFFEPLPEDQFERLVASIKECGLLNPIVVKKEENKYKIIDGRNRYRALCALGIEEIPVYVLNTLHTEDTIYQYDVELCRRHLNKEDIERKWQHERENYFNSIKKTIKRKILTALNMEETETLKNFLDSLTLQQLLNLHSQLQSLSAFPKFINTLAKHILSQVKTVAEANGVKEEIEKASNLFFQKQIEELQTQLKEKEETLLELEMRLEETIKAKNQLEKDYDIVRKASQKKLEELAKKLTEEKEEQIKALEQEILKLKAQQAPPEAIKKLTEEFEKKHIKALNEIKEKYQKEEAEYRSKINELQTEILNMKKILQEEKETKDKLKKDLQFAIAEREKIRDKLNDLLATYKELTSEKVLLNQLKTLREQLHLTLQLAYNLTSLDSTQLLQVKTIWTDIKGVYKELEDYIEKTVLLSAETKKEQE